MNHSYFSTRRAPLVTIFFTALLLLCGCSIPKIVVLHDPLSAEEHDNLGKIYESQGKLDLAGQQYRAAVKIDPKSAIPLLLLADLSFRTKQYSEAESSYKKAIKLQPENGDIYNNLCWVYLEQNAGIEKAEDLIRTAMAKTPQHRAYYLDTLGVVFLRQGRGPEAIAALKEAVLLLPKDNPAYLGEAYAHLAEAYRSAGDELNAREAEKEAENYRARK